MTGEPAVETPTATVPAAPAAQPPAPVVPAPSAPPAVQPTAGGEQISIPRSSVPGGDWHNLIGQYKNMEPYAAALETARASGIDPATLAYMMQMYGGAPPDPQLQPPYQPAPAYPAPPAQPGVTEESITTIVNQALDRALTGDGFRNAIGSTFDARQQDWDRTKQAEWQQAESIRVAQDAEQKYGTTLIEGMGFKLKNEDESPNFLGVAVQKEFNGAVNTVLAQNEPAELRAAYAEEVEKGINEGPAFQRLRTYYSTPNEDTLTKAGETLGHWKHLRWEIQAGAAAQQAGIPATPGAGPSAGPPPTPTSEMTEADHEAAASTYEQGSAPNIREEEGGGWPDHD